MKTLEHKLNELFTNNLPELPVSTKEKLAKLLPLLSLIAGIVGLLFILPLLGIGGLGSAVGIAGGQFLWTLVMWVGIIGSIVSTFLYLMAYPKLKKWLKKGWDYVFYANIIYIISGLFDLISSRFANMGGFVTNLLIAALVLYLLFQVRKYYTGEASVAAPVFTSKETNKH